MIVTMTKNAYGPKFNYVAGLAYDLSDAQAKEWKQKGEDGIPVARESTKKEIEKFERRKKMDEAHKSA